MTYPETLPDVAGESDPGHITDHNLIRTAVSNIDSRVNLNAESLELARSFSIAGGNSLPGVNTSGFTQTVVSASTSTISNAYLVSPNDPALKYTNAIMDNVGVLGSFSNCYKQRASTYTFTTDHMSGLLNLSFNSDAEELDFIVHTTTKVNVHQDFRFMIDDVYVMSAPVSIPNATGFYRIKATITGGLKTRSWRLEASGVTFCGVYRAPNRSLWSNTKKVGPRLVDVGDSYCMAASASGGRPWIWGNYMYQSSFITGWDVHPNAIGGTGFQNDNYGNGDPTYLSRLASQVIAVAPDMVAVHVSVNDPYYSSYNLSTVQSNMNAWFLQLYTALPNVHVFGIAGIVCNSNVYSQLSSISSNLQTQCTYYGASYINSLSWLYGAGRSDAPTGLGNTDGYIGPDGVHLTDAGNTYLAERIASAVSDIYSKRSYR